LAQKVTEHEEKALELSERAKAEENGRISAAKHAEQIARDLEAKATEATVGAQRMDVSL
jgi:hypothetical protein